MLLSIGEMRGLDLEAELDHLCAFLPLALTLPPGTFTVLRLRSPEVGPTSGLGLGLQ